MENCSIKGDSVAIDSTDGVKIVTIDSVNNKDGEKKVHLKKKQKQSFKRRGK
jgi:hypothetical protein